MSNKTHLVLARGKLVLQKRMSTEIQKQIVGLRSLSPPHAGICATSLSLSLLSMCVCVSVCVSVSVFVSAKGQFKDLCAAGVPESGLESR